MTAKLRQSCALAPAFLMAGCVSAPQGPATQPVPTRPSVISVAGLEAVVGQNARSLTARFGTPDLDVREGTARKLQFSGPACVLDAYLYPRSNGAEPVVTYVDARLPDGRDMDRASCVASLIAQSQTR